MANPPIRLVKHTQCKLSLWYYKLLTFNMKKYNEEYNLKMFYGCIRATLRNYYIFFHYVALIFVQFWMPLLLGKTLSSGVFKERRSKYSCNLVVVHETGST